MKCADLGHLGAPTHVHLKWVHLLEEEMFQQGDFEKARGYPVSPLMDRDKGGITSSQPGVSHFMIVHPSNPSHACFFVASQFLTC